MSFFFFQAEDGIRDLVRSRGLGDVYKRQGEEVGLLAALGAANLDDDVAVVVGVAGDEQDLDPVSYTHLTLPTSDLV